MKKIILSAVALIYLVALVFSLLTLIKPGPAIFNSISYPAGILCFAFLLYGILRFIGFLIQGKFLRLRRRDGLVKICADFFDHLKLAYLSIYTHSRSAWRLRLVEVGKLFLITSVSAYLLVLIEWIFHISRVSFMDSVNLGQKLSVLLLSGLFVALAAMALNAACLLIEFLLRPLRLAWLAACLNTVIPTALLTSLVALWVDTFTYTIFHFGILTSDGLFRLVYGVLVVLLFFGLFSWLLTLQGLKNQVGLKPSPIKWLRGIILGLLAISSVLALTQYGRQAPGGISAENDPVSAEQLPNIILIGSDGVSATHMSLYGYMRETTPNIDALGEISLVAENALCNSSKTFGSIISIFTSKMPTRTQTMFPPDILHGIDSDQHLLAILKDLGYTTAQIGVNEYVDANTWNVHRAFDYVNQRTVESNILVKTLDQWGYELPAYFLITTEGRLVNRLLQALHIETIENPFSTAANAPEWSGDHRRMDDLFNLLESSPNPLFVHVHLVETHGPKYDPAIQKFSLGLEQTGKWMPPFYDDTILSFDAYVGQLIDALKTSGQFDHTLLIIYSDHAMGFQTAERVPLLFHFPGDQHIGRIQTNVQNLDIAPTILEYLGVTVPAWMEGESILHFSNQVREPLFAVRMNNGKEIEYPQPADPSLNTFETENHQFSILQIFYCQRVYQLDLSKNEWGIIYIKKHTDPCSEKSLPRVGDMRKYAIQFFTDQGIDPSIVP